ncbi:sodium:proton antiporter NhaD [Oceanospirillum linum]|uniref:Sodium:proton antiporter n=1 Tax=Oceanospirillum linum TaxID=966 RepID=A0A1T1HA56_OCELI|nr:sodium:proton antiporter NhaD [Oceanospirillum linum]OOV86695.1 sodium:proton antiporter [Oceanospirillum linum]SEG26034.1 Na+/H+ antiporter NhaD [Oleiphilus messinensis]SMP27896.1 sodium/proton antiporter, NhaD family [Oceanospirillum linum]
MTELLHTILLALAFLALLGVVFEEVIHINKAKVTLFLGTVSWLLMFIFPESDAGLARIEEGLSESISEIAELWLFLVAAMTFVAYLNKKGLIQNLIYLFLPSRISEKMLLVLTGLFCFIFSSIADNITATLVSAALILSLNLEAKKTLRFAALVVFAVNSGGVALITGDVTTLMIFLSGHVGVLQLLYLSLPALLGVVALTLMLSFGLKGNVVIEKRMTPIRKVDLIIAVVFLSTILLTIAFNALFHIPPMLTFLAGMSLMFLVARFFEDDDEDPIMDYIRVIEFETLLFFLGILLLVGMLKEIGVLESLVSLYELMPPVLANYMMGVLSAGIDNVPLTAAVLKSGIDMTTQEWMGLTYAVGVGGSLLVIGSAAGIVMMSKIGALTFGRYVRFILPLLVAYTIGYAGAWVLGHWMF